MTFSYKILSYIRSLNHNLSCLQTDEKKEIKSEEKKDAKAPEIKSDDIDVDDVKKQIADLNNKLQKLEMKKLEAKVEIF